MKTTITTAVRLWMLLATVLAALTVTACDPPSCKSCSSQEDCTEKGEECYEFSDGKNRCAGDEGDTC